MSQAFSSIGSILSGKGGGILGAGASLLSNFFGNRQKNKYLQDQINYQKFLRSLSTDPAKMSQYISGFEKPLSQGLLTGVGNAAQAFGAERGLSTSPQIMTEIESQALAPYMMQEQQQATSTALSSLGLPAGTPDMSGVGGPMDISSIMKQLLGSPTTAAPGDIPVPPVGSTPEGPALPPDSGDGGFDLSSLLDQLGTGAFAF